MFRESDSEESEHSAPRGKRSGLLASYHGSELLADLRHVLALARNRRGVRQQAIELRDHDLERLDIRFHLGELTTQTDKPPRFDRRR